MIKPGFKVYLSKAGVRSVNIVDKNIRQKTPLTQEEILILRQLQEYLGGKRLVFDIKLDLQGTPFQLKVWKTLQTIPYGKTATYQEIANKIKQPKAIRAVANAIGANPIAIIIPCHRIIRTDGALGGYKWGTKLKSQLVHLESKGCSQQGNL